MKRPTGSAATVSAALALGVWLTAGGCLNPRPEELPSTIEPPDYSNTDDADESNDSEVPGAPGTGPTAPGYAANPTEADGSPGPADAGAPDAGPRAGETGIGSEPASQIEAGEPPE